MIGYEEKLLIADILEDAANRIGKAVLCVEGMAKRDIETIRSEPDAADDVCIKGPEVIKALRLLQRRYVR